MKISALSWTFAGLLIAGRSAASADTPDPNADIATQHEAYGKCWAHDSSEWLKSHNDPRPDNKVIADSLNAIMASCRQRFLHDTSPPSSVQPAASVPAPPARPWITLPEDAPDCEGETAGPFPPEPEALKPGASLNDQGTYANAIEEIDKAEFSQACKSRGTAGTLVWTRVRLWGGNYGPLSDPQFKVLRPEDGHAVLYRSSISLGSTPIGATVHDQLVVRAITYPQNQGPITLWALRHYESGQYHLLPLNYTSSDTTRTDGIPVGALSAAYDARAGKYLLFIPRTEFITPSWDKSVPSWQHYYVWWLDTNKDEVRRVLLPPGPWVSDAKLDGVLDRDALNFSCGVDCYRHSDIKSADGGDIYVTVTGRSSAIGEAALGTYKLKAGENAWVKQQ
jgi:hypothetical protein